jgi:ribosome-binding ATPase YchF (GTP1/OBG family)
MNIGMMHGGGDIEQELQNINRQYGYELFKNIYESLNNTMKNLSADSRSMRMSSESDKAIREKLEKLKQLEQEITKALERTVERNALITASRGKIQAYRLSDEELPAILAKHSNLLNWTQAYNRKAINLIDVFKTISDALLGKLQVKQADATAQYNRPLRADIPLTPTN